MHCLVDKLTTFLCAYRFLKRVNYEEKSPYVYDGYQFKEKRSVALSLVLAFAQHRNALQLQDLRRAQTEARIAMMEVARLEQEAGVRAKAAAREREQWGRTLSLNIGGEPSTSGASDRGSSVE